MPADRRLPGAGSADAAPGARPRDRPRPHRSRGLARIRLRGRGISAAGHERFCANLERDPAAALVHGGAARAGGARIAALQLRAPLRRAGGARRALHAARVSAPARARRTHVPHARPRRRRRRSLPRGAASAEPSPPSGGACSRPAEPLSCWWWRRWSTASITRSPISTRSCARSRSRWSTTI